MCGRFALAFIPPEKLKQLFCLDQTEALPVSYNIAPSYAIPVIREIDKRRFLSLLQWGLIPQWANDPTIGKKIINARSETVSEKPAFDRRSGRDGALSWLADFMSGHIRPMARFLTSYRHRMQRPWLSPDFGIPGHRPMGR